MDVITIATYAKPEEAHLARLRLGREGIDAFVADENVVQLNWMLTNAVGGVRLLVAEDDVEEAVATLTEEPVRTEAVGEHPPCPQCQSTGSEPYFAPRRMAGLSLLLSLPLFFFIRWHRWRCRDCGNTWR